MRLKACEEKSILSLEKKDLERLIKRYRDKIKEIEGRGRRGAEYIWGRKIKRWENRIKQINL